MTILVIDTSMDYGTVGISIADSVSAQFQFHIKKGSTNTVHFYIKSAFNQTGIKPSEVNLIGVVIGPGSFTGLRVALSAAKGLAHPFNIPVVGIESAHAIAELIEDEGRTVVLMDARRSQYYRAVYSRTSDCLNKISGPEAIDRDKCLENIPPGTVITGPGVRNLDENQLKDYTVAPEEIHYPNAAALSKLARHLFDSQNTIDIANSVPLYIRKPDAMM